MTPPPREIGKPSSSSPIRSWLFLSTFRTRPLSANWDRFDGEEAEDSPSDDAELTYEGTKYVRPVDMATYNKALATKDYLVLDITHPQCSRCRLVSLPLLCVAAPQKFLCHSLRSACLTSFLLLAGGPQLFPVNIFEGGQEYEEGGR